MSKLNPEDLGNLSMLELFRVEAETQLSLLTNGLLELERASAGPQQLETLMRAAHSLKGAARIINLRSGIRMAHAMEDFFVAAQKGRVHLSKPQTDVLLHAADLLLHISRRTETDVAAWEAEHADEIKTVMEAIAALMPVDGSDPSGFGPPTAAADASLACTADSPLPLAPVRQYDAPERVLRLTAENLNRLLGLAGESLVESRWLRPFSDSMQRLKRLHADLTNTLDGLRKSLDQQSLTAPAESHLFETFDKLTECRQFLDDRLQELDLFDRRSAHLSHRLYLEVLRARMRPFGDGTRRFPRMVRDLARSLRKEVRLEVTGESTQVDRDILERLETPLAHLLRNAVDHGCESPHQRERSGKSAEGLIHLDARHSAGMLQVTVSDDGAGIDLHRLRSVIVQRRLATASLAEKLTESELLEFLYLPGFTMKETVTEISGRGVGLDVVQNMVRSVRGNIRISTQPGRGTRFQLQLPLTLSVLRTLLVEIAGEPYAIPLSQISRALKLPRDKIFTLEGRHHFTLGEQQVGLLLAHQVLDCPESRPPHCDLPVVVLGNRATRYGLIVDRLLGERELVVQPLDPRLGKIPDISAAALMENGSPVLIVDVDDMMRSIERLISGGALTQMQEAEPGFGGRLRKRILAVDDSLAVRELERKLLASRGYETDVAVDGMDAWNAVRNGEYDLIITDVDMPRMDGVELAALIKKDPRLKTIPVMIVSYKDHDEDRLRGLDAGADYYLTKGTFHDDALLQAVLDLIGEPEK